MYEGHLIHFHDVIIGLSKEAMLRVRVIGPGPLRASALQPPIPQTLHSALQPPDPKSCTPRANCMDLEILT